MAFVAALSAGVTITVEADATDWREVQTLDHAIIEADRRGDFENATKAAEKCVTITRGTLGDYHCAYYLSSALRNGRGMPRDEARAFALLNELVVTDRNGDAALAMAEAYLDGAGTPRDPVEAGVILWRVKHGAWSIYSDYWGMCDDCGELWAHEKAVDKRIERELTAEEKRRVEVTAAALFPEIAACVTHRDTHIEVTTALLATVTGGLLWWRSWSRRRSNPKAA